MMMPTAHRGLLTLARPTQPPVLHTDDAVLLSDPAGDVAFLNTVVSGTSRVSTTGASFDACFVDARLKGNGMIHAEDSVIAAMWDGVGFWIRNCWIGSARRPDGMYLRALEDGIRPCRVPGTSVPAQWSQIVDSFVVNLDGRNGAKHMDGVQLWQDGELSIMDTKVQGWWQSSVMLKSDYGPIDSVSLIGCSFSGANYFNLRFIDGGFGRPTNVSVIECVVAKGVKGGAHPVNTGDDLCSLKSQTKFVRSEEERLDPAWVVYRDVCLPDGTELPPPGGWFKP